MTKNNTADPSEKDRPLKYQVARISAASLSA
jgi:hypothetical protein